MKLLRIGFIAALALALHGQALAAAAPAAGKIDPKMRDQGMKEAPAAVQHCHGAPGMITTLGLLEEPIDDLHPFIGLLVT